MSTKRWPSASKDKTSNQNSASSGEDGSIRKKGGVKSPFRSMLLLLTGAFLYWGALPPLNVWPLIFLVPVVWTVLIERSELRLRTVYASAFVFWIASIWWIACPHPMTTLGLIALSAYLSLYWVLFFAASRIAVHRFRIPVIAAAPLCWVGCEFLRNHLLGGFSFCALEHALYLRPRFIQIADIAGTYTVAAMIMLVGTGVGVTLSQALNAEPNDGSKKDSSSKHFPPKGFPSGLIAVTALLLSVFYGIYVEGPVKLRDSLPDRPELRVATLQGNIPVRLDGDMEDAEKTFEQFVDLSYEAARSAKREGKPLDLIVWPETVCPIPVVLFNGSIKPSDIGFTDDEAVRWRQQLQGLVDNVGIPILFGISTYRFGNVSQPTRLNSALIVFPEFHRILADQDGDGIGPRYDKVHLVMFGEYIPFSEYLPDDFFLKTLCQEAGRGLATVAMPLGEKKWFSVNICFESSVPHLVRNQVSRLNAEGNNPAFLVNISNDGWFRFSRQIDQHLATHVFRAVENRKPYITATNGGFSATIDAKGRIQKIGTRGEAETIVADLTLWGENMPIYELIGDAPAMFCTALLVLLLFTSCFKKTENNSRNGA